MYWEMVYTDGSAQPMILGKYASMPKDNVAKVQAFNNDGVSVFETFPPRDRTGHNLRWRVTSETGTGIRWWKVGWEPYGPAYAIDDATGKTYQAYRFHEPCTKDCGDHPPGWFAPPQPIGDER